MSSPDTTRDYHENNGKDPDLKTEAELAENLYRELEESITETVWQVSTNEKKHVWS